METTFLHIAYPEIEYNHFTWGSNADLDLHNCLLGVPVDKAKLEELGRRIWENYQKAIEDSPDYFKKWNEPFPDAETAIASAPLDLEKYMKESELWNNFIIEELAEILNWSFTDARYNILRLESACFREETFYLVFYAIDHRDNQSEFDYDNR